MKSEELSIGYSPCPNDTFIFHGLVHGLAGASGITLAEPQLLDVESLNEWALYGCLDVSKISCHALGHVLGEYRLLAAGAALGHGCGPLLVARDLLTPNELGHCRIAIPGRLTTAALLFRLFAPQCADLVPMRFDLIMPAIKAGQVDAGVIIHEGRFTFKQYGLCCLRDLGGWWEEVSGSPIPLGCIVAKRSLGEAKLTLLEDLIRASIRQAFDSPELSREYICRHAQELDEQVVAEHIRLYVNNFSLELGKEGRNAITQLMVRGREAGVFPGMPTESDFMSDLLSG